MNHFYILLKELNQKEYDKKDLFQQYCQDNDGIIPFEQRTFTNMIKDYAKAKKMEVVETKKNGRSYIQLVS